MHICAMSSFRFVIAASTAACLLALLAQPVSPAAADEDVRVQFYMLQLEQWGKQGLEAKFKATLAKGAVKFCQANITACGAANSSADLLNSLTPSSVHLTPGYPAIVESHYLALRVSVSYWLANDTTGVYLSAADTTTILEANRLQLNDQLGYYIVYIGDQFYSIPPPHMLNTIVVSASGGFTLLLIAIAFILRSCYDDSAALLKRSHQGLNAAAHRKQEVDRSRNGQSETAGRAVANSCPGDDGDDTTGRQNPGFDDSQPCSSSQLSDSTSPVLPSQPATATDAAPEEAGRRKRMDKKAAAVIDSSEQIMLSETADHHSTGKNGSLLGNGTAANGNKSDTNNIDDERDKDLE